MRDMRRAVGWSGQLLSWPMLAAEPAGFLAVGLAEASPSIAASNRSDWATGLGLVLAAIGTYMPTIDLAC
jgi:hypothetical protein